MSKLMVPSQSDSQPENTRIKIHCAVKGFHECPFTIDVGEEIFTHKKHGSKGRAIKVSSERGQLGHLQRELVSPLWPFKDGMKW